MAIKLKNGAVFLHIPKTGGNWVTKVLNELNLIEAHIGHKHADIDHLFAPRFAGRRQLLDYTMRRMFTPLWSAGKPFMFCFVRNPLSWYESWFKYMEQSSRQWRFWGDEKNAYKWHPNSMLNGLGECDFSEFVSKVNIKRPGYVTELYGWYTGPQIDFIGRQECLRDDLIKVLTIMGLDFDEDLVRGFGNVGVSAAPVKQISWPKNLKVQTVALEYAGMIRYGYEDTLKELGMDMPTLTRISS